MKVYSLDILRPNLEPVCYSLSSANCCFLTCIQISQEACQVVQYSHLFKHFPQFVMIHIVKDFGVVNKAEVDVFLELSCFFHDPADVVIHSNRSVFIPIPKKGNAKECSNYHTIALISHASKVMLKILQARLQQYVNRELPDVQAGFRKGRGTRDQISNIHWTTEKAREFQKKHLLLLHWLCQSLWLCGSQ